MKFSNPNRPRQVPTGPMPLKRTPRSVGAPRFHVSLVGGPLANVALSCRSGGTLAFRMRGGTYPAAPARGDSVFVKDAR